MTRLARVLNLLESYDELSANLLESHVYGKRLLAGLREEKEKLTKELIEHGCRRKN